jgi:hydroxyacylglutathione hydrolase
LYLSAEGGDFWRSIWAEGLPGYRPLHDGDTFHVGNIEFRAVHTPGHTPEHTVFLVTDRGGGADEPIAMLSGDFLFVGDAGRPDLLEQAAGLEGTQEAGAKALYQSLRKVSGLADHVQVLPGHGAGSACGKSLGAVPNSTFGYEKKFNPALKLALNSSETEFVEFILSGQPEPPAYFANMKHVNRVGPALLGALPKPPVLELEKIAAGLGNPGFVVLDTRARGGFLKKHLRRSLFAPPEKFSDFAGSYLLPEEQIVLVVSNPADAEGFVRQLVRIGFDHVVGVLPSGAVDAAPEEFCDAIESLPFDGLGELLAGGLKPSLLDVRKETEFLGGHLRGAANIPHTRLLPRLREVPAGPLLVNCQSGMRATGACAFLARNGWKATAFIDKFENAPQELLA